MADQQVTTTRSASLTTAVLKESTIQQFKASLSGALLRPTEAGYDDARKIWNGMVDKRPALIARCRGVADVISSVRFARTHDLLLAVRGGGHNLAGNAVCDGGLMIDLSLMKGVRVDPAPRTASAQTGLTWGELDHETQAFGLAVTGGQISTTGIAGLTLGGGWGYLARQHGLASDNLLSVDLVTADGEFLTASAAEHADLFWGVRGGGGNFGVATSFEYQLHPVGPVLAGIVAYPIAKATEVLRCFSEVTSAAPDELASGIIMVTFPDGTPVVAMVVCYNGPSEKGERVLKPLRTIGSPLMDQVNSMPYTSAQKLIDGFYPPGLQNYWKSNFLKKVSDEAIDTMVAHCAERPSPTCHGLIEHQLGGAVSRVGREATAFNHRDVQYSFMSIGVCATVAEVPSCVRWVREFWSAMQPYSTGSVYVNYLGQEADEGAERIKAAYGPEKYQRLAALKNKYDPTNLFRLNQNIRPAPAV
jgi:FAD binding domain/Berberine and berberine like